MPPRILQTVADGHAVDIRRRSVARHPVAKRSTREERAWDKEGRMRTGWEAGWLLLLLGRPKHCVAFHNTAARLTRVRSYAKASKSLSRLYQAHALATEHLTPLSPPVRASSMEHEQSFYNDFDFAPFAHCNTFGNQDSCICYSSHWSLAVQSYSVYDRYQYGRTLWRY